MQQFKYLLLILTLAMSQQLNAEEKKTIPNVSLDNLINEFKATRENSVEITMFRKIGFSGVIKEMPYLRTHAYLSKTIAKVAPESNVIATHGLTVGSENGQTLPVYIIDELKPGMETHLKIGDRVNFEAYHAYNSNVGPGLLVYSWEKVTEPSALATWFDGLFN